MSPSRPTVVSGASGFVGRALRARIDAAGTLRLGGDDWREQIGGAPLEGATVFHLAARVHHPGTQDAAAYMADNAEKTRVLAQAAARGHARRFVFLSTIKVNGEETRGQPFRADDVAAPEDAYARSKHAAEQALAQVSADTGLDVVIVRSALVYGPLVRGNLRSMVALADSPWPLPFGALDNRRSFVHVDDLARLLVDCGTHPQAPGRTYLAAHARSVSTKELAEALRRLLGRPRRLVNVPAPLLEAAGAIAGQRERVRRLTRSLEVDASAAARDLDWTAQVTFEQAAEEMVLAYRAEPRA